MARITDWEQDGFGEAPTTHKSKGGEEIMRAYSAHALLDHAGNKFGSKLKGNCFFVFTSDMVEGCAGRVSRSRLCDIGVEELEHNLNAALWGNTYDLIQVFELPAATTYLIGPIGHAIRTLENKQSYVIDPSVEPSLKPVPVSRYSTMDSRTPGGNACMQVKIVGVVNLAHVGKPFRVRDSYRFHSNRSGYAH